MDKRRRPPTATQLKLLLVFCSLHFHWVSFQARLRRATFLFAAVFTTLALARDVVPAAGHLAAEPAAVAAAQLRRLAHTLLAAFGGAQLAASMARALATRSHGQLFAAVHAAPLAATMAHARVELGLGQLLAPVHAAPLSAAVAHALGSRHSTRVFACLITPRLAAPHAAAVRYAARQPALGRLDRPFAALELAHFQATVGPTEGKSRRSRAFLAALFLAPPSSAVLTALGVRHSTRVLACLLTPRLAAPHAAAVRCAARQPALGHIDRLCAALDLAPFLAAVGTTVWTSSRPRAMLAARFLAPPPPAVLLATPASAVDGAVVALRVRAPRPSTVF